MELTRTSIINRLIKKHGYTSYLEIGYGDGVHYSQVECQHKTGVDPNQGGTAPFKMTSDAYFEQNYTFGKKTFDIIFIDGLHEAAQVYQDIVNSLNVLKEGGTIVCHDMLPSYESMQAVPRRQEEWTGDCWRAWMQFRQVRDDLTMYVVDADYGVGVIQRGSQDLIPGAPPTWPEMEKDQKRLMNAISPSQFSKMTQCRP